MAEDSKSENEKRFEVLIYLELTSAALEECFGIINEGRYNNEVKKRIDEEYGDLKKHIFKNNSKDLTNIGKYGVAIIGKSVSKEKSPDLMVKKGLEHILKNIEPLENLKDSGDYSTLKGESAKNLSEFFGYLARRYAEKANQIREKS